MMVIQAARITFWDNSVNIGAMLIDTNIGMVLIDRNSEKKPIRKPTLET